MDVNTNNSIALNYAQAMETRLNEGGLANQAIVRGQALAYPVALALLGGAAPTLSGLGGLTASPLKFAGCLVGLSTLDEAVNHVKTQAYKVVCGLANIVKAFALTVTVPFTVIAPRLAVWIGTLGCERPQAQDAPAPLPGIELYPALRTQMNPQETEESKDIEGDKTQVIVETPVVKTGFFSKITKTHVAAGVVLAVLAGLAAFKLTNNAETPAPKANEYPTNCGDQTCFKTPAFNFYRDIVRQTCDLRKVHATVTPNIPNFVDVNQTCVRV